MSGREFYIADIELDSHALYAVLIPIGAQREVTGNGDFVALVQILRADLCLSAPGCAAVEIGQVAAAGVPRACVARQCKGRAGRVVCL